MDENLEKRNVKSPQRRPRRIYLANWEMRVDRFAAIQNYANDNNLHFDDAMEQVIDAGLSALAELVYEHVPEQENNLILKNEEEEDIYPEKDQVGESSDEENLSPYDSEIIAFFNNLDAKGKYLLKKILKANPAASNIGTSTAHREIQKHVNKLCPYSRNRRDIAQCKKDRRKLFDYLTKEEIL